MATQPQARPFADVNSRIDNCLQTTASEGTVLWVILCLMFLVGVFVVIYGALNANKYLVGAGVGASGLCTWPVLRLIQLHQRKIALSVIPTITALLSPRDATREIHLLIVHLLDKP